MANTQQNRGRALPASVAIVLLIALAIFAVHHFTQEKVLVRVAEVTRRDLVSTVSTNGKVEPVDGAEFQAHAPSQGVVKKIYVRVNQHVEPGTLLLSMNDADAHARLAGAEAMLSSAQLGVQDVGNGGSLEELQRFRQDVSSAQVERDHAASDLATEQTLQQKGAASAAEVLRAQQRLQTAAATLNNAQARLQQRFSPLDLTNQKARVADARGSIAAARSALAATDIRSPIAGTVYSIPVSEFDFVRDGDDLMDVADLSDLQVRAYFDEPDIGKLQAGEPVKIVWEANKDKVWHGHILRAPTTVITYGTRNVGEAVISVDDAKGDLPPNSNVTVTVTTQQRPNALSIPREALHTEGMSDFVFRIVDGKLARTPVKVGVVTTTEVEVLSGLSDKDVVVLGAVNPSQDLSSGLPVEQVQ